MHWIERYAASRSIQHRRRFRLRIGVAISHQPHVARLRQRTCIDAPQSHPRSGIFPHGPTLRQTALAHRRKWLGDVSSKCQTYPRVLGATPIGSSSPRPTSESSCHCPNHRQRTILPPNRPRRFRECPKPAPQMYQMWPAGFRANGAHLLATQWTPRNIAKTPIHPPWPLWWPVLWRRV